MTKTEQMLEIALKNQVLILRALYETAPKAQQREAIWQAAHLTEQWVNAHAHADLKRKR